MHGYCLQNRYRISNCLPNSTFKRLKISNPLETSNATLTAYTGDQMTVRGKINLTCAYKNKSVNTDFYIVESTASPLLEPTSWVNSLVCVEKPNGKIRICLDPKALDDNIRRPDYPMRSIDDITATKYFSVLDATKGYWSICLDQESSFLTTFNTPFGRYRYLRLPMGIRSSQDIFQRKVDEMLEGLLGVTSICDDILVFGRTRAEHDSNLEKVLQKSRDI